MKKNPELEQCTLPLYGRTVSYLLEHDFEKLHQIMKSNPFSEIEKNYICRVVDERMTHNGTDYHFWD